MNVALRLGSAVAAGIILSAIMTLTACAKRPAPQPAEPPKIAAAADLAFAFAEVGDAFEKRTGVKPVFVFGSSGLLAKQVEEGAPFDVFAAASSSFTTEAAKSGACDPATQSFYARGRIVLWTRNGTIAAPVTIGDLANERFKRIAIANPEHAPYGRAAQQALEHAGIWEVVKPKLVFGENVQQTLKFAETGNVEAAIVALSLALATKGGQYVVLDSSLHKPLAQALIACRHGKNPGDGRRFVEFLASADGRAIMKRFGFLLPGDPEP